MSDKKFDDFLGGLVSDAVQKKSKERYEKNLAEWKQDKQTIKDLEELGSAPEKLKELKKRTDEMERYLYIQGQLYGDKEKFRTVVSDQKVEAAKKPSLLGRAKELRRTEPARMLFGPEVGYIGDRKPAGNYIQQHGLIGAAFRPTPMVDWVPTFSEDERDGTAKKIGKGAANAIINFGKSLGSLGGLATMGGMSKLKAASDVAKVKNWSRAKDAESALKMGHKVFALDLTRNVLEHNPEVRRIAYDKNKSAQEKTEAILGHVILAGLATGAYRGGFKNEVSKAKTPKQALEIYNRWSRKQREAQAKEIEGRRTEKEMLPQEVRELEIARRAEEAKSTIPEQEIIEMARAEKAAKLVEPIKEAKKQDLKPDTDPLEEAMKRIEEGESLESVWESTKEKLDLAPESKAPEVLGKFDPALDVPTTLAEFKKAISARAVPFLSAREGRGEQVAGAQPREIVSDLKNKRTVEELSSAMRDVLGRQKEKPKVEAGSEALKKLQDISDNLEAVDSTHKRLKGILLGEKLPYSFTDLSGKIIIPANKKITGSKLRELAEMWVDGRKFDIIGEGGSKGVPENLRLAVLRAVEPNYSWETMRDPIWMEPKSKVAEPSKPADPVVESLKQEKIEDAAIREAEIESAKEARIEAEIESPVPSTESSKAFHKIIKRHIEKARQEGDTEAVARMIENPDSEYSIMNTSRKADVIDTMDMPSINDQLASLAEKPLSVEKALLNQKKIELLWEAQRKSKKSEDLQTYEDAVQQYANESTYLGQLIQARNYFKASNPEVTIDLIRAAIKKNKGPELTEKEVSTLREIVSDVRDTQKKADETAKAFEREGTDASWNTAVDAFKKAESAKNKQLDFLEKKNPKAFADLIVSFLQGNFLTPTTLAVNVVGNIAPLPARAGARVVARGIDIIDQFLMRPRREAERQRLREEQQANPTAENAARLNKLEEMLSPMEQMRISPVSGTLQKMQGLLDTTGVKRLYEARKISKEKGIPLMEAFKEGQSGPIKSDIISSLILGDRVNLYETGTLDATNITAPVDAFRAGARLADLVKNKPSTTKMSVAKDLMETAGGLSPTVFFRLLAAGDVPFRGAEMRRLISEQAEIRGFDKKMLDRAMEYPELVFGEKDWARIKNEAARATFQQENIGTKGSSWLNELIRKEGTDAAYTAWRAKTPYQKTLINLFGELVNFTPIGMVDVAFKTKKAGFLTKDAKISAGKVVTGTAALSLAQWLMDNDIMSADLDPFMSDTSDTKKIRYMTEQTFHHGHINISALNRKMNGKDTAYQKGDYIVDARRMGPFGFILLNNANYHRYLEKLPKEEREKLQESWTAMLKERSTRGLTHSARYGINTTMATGIRDFAQGVSNFINDKSGTRVSDTLAKDLMTVFLPNTLSWWQRNNSPYRQSFKPDDFTDALKTEWSKKISSNWDKDGLVEGYPIIADLWGTPLESIPEGTVLGTNKTANWQRTEAGKDTLMDRMMSSTFNIFKLKKSGAIFDPYSSEVYRLWRKFGDNGVVPSWIDRKQVIDGKEYELNRDQYAYLTAVAGRYRLLGSEEDRGAGTRFRMKVHDGVVQLINRPDYMDGMTDEEKVKELKRIYSKQLSLAKKDAVKFWEKGEDDGFTRAFNIDIKNLPLKPEQEVKTPSGRLEDN